MENTFTKEQLNAFEKDILVTMILQQQSALLEMNKKFDLLLEQIRISNQARFGQSSEKVELQNQLTFCFNEAEVTVADVGDITEPTIEQVIPEHKRRVKKKGKRNEDFSAFPVGSILQSIFFRCFLFMPIQQTMLVSRKILRAVSK